MKIDQKLLWEIVSLALAGVVALQQGKIEQFNRESKIKIIGPSGIKLDKKKDIPHEEGKGKSP